MAIEIKVITIDGADYYNDWEPGVENWTEVTDGIVATGGAVIEEEDEF